MNHRIRHHSISQHIALKHMISYHITSHSVTSNNITSHSITSYRITSHCITSDESHNPVSHYIKRAANHMLQSMLQRRSETLIRSFILMRLDYCNLIAIPCWLPGLRLHQFPSVLNWASRVVTNKQKISQISQYVRENLHWLPVTERISMCVYVSGYYRAFKNSRGWGVCGLDLL